MHILRIKNVYKSRGLFYTIGFIFKSYIINGTKEANILNIW